MLKKLAFPAIALMTMLLVLAPSPASARVRFGIAVGAAPVYPAPVAPYAYGNPYPYAPYPDYYSYPAPAYPYAYSYGPSYVQPYSGFGFSFGGHRDYDRGWGRERREFRGHEGRGRR